MKVPDLFLQEFYSNWLGVCDLPILQFIFLHMVRQTEKWAKIVKAFEWLDIS